jgi:hypothetical protein
MADRVLTTEEALELIARRLLVGVQAAANVVRTDAVKSVNRSQPIRRSKSGRTVGLDPSAVGEPPKRLTGALIQSIQAPGAVREGDSVVAPIVAGTKYARRLEFGFIGTDARGRRISQGPRPFMRPALERVRPRLAEIIAKAAKGS